MGVFRVGTSNQLNLQNAFFNKFNSFRKCSLNSLKLINLESSLNALTGSTSGSSTVFREPLEVCKIIYLQIYKFMLLCVEQKTSLISLNESITLLLLAKQTLLYSWNNSRTNVHIIKFLQSPKKCFVKNASMCMCICVNDFLARPFEQYL